MHHLKTLLVIIACAGTVALSPPARAQHVTPTAAWVKLNGIVTPVFFNDGDTFRPLAGPMRFRPARLALANSGFFGIPAVIGVSTKPGLRVITPTPDRYSR